MQGKSKISQYPYRFETFGVNIHRSSALLMERVHSHNEIEVNCVESGEIHYQLNEERHTFKPNFLYVFNGLAPHRLIDCPVGSVFHWLTIPHVFLKQWDLPESFYNALLDGRVLVDGDATEAIHDVRRFQRWEEDFVKADTRYMRVALLEIRCRLERMALSVPLTRSKKGSAPHPVKRNPFHIASAMQGYIVRHLNQSVTLHDIARSVKLHPKYASSLFRKETGRTPMRFLNEQRLAYAKLLLASTDQKVINIALESGFGSQSQFYDAFKKANNISPAKFRKEIQGQQEQSPLSTNSYATTT